jgi:hypothetical protein
MVTPATGAGIVGPRGDTGGMSNSDTPQRIHIVIGDDWRAAVRTVLRLDRTPWRGGPQQAAPGDGIALLLNTEPRSIVTTLQRQGRSIDADYALMPVAALRGPDYGFDGDDIETWFLDGELAQQLAAELDEHRFGWDGARWGHHSMAAAAILLHAAGTCDGCGKARDVEPWTVDPKGGDFPAALCAQCRQRMRDNAFGTFLDYKIGQNPRCPACRAQRTLSIVYGMPVHHAMVPWHAYAGCCLSEEQWSCLACDHSW